MILSQISGEKAVLILQDCKTAILITEDHHQDHGDNEFENWVEEKLCHTQLLVQGMSRTYLFIISCDRKKSSPR